MAKYSNSVSYHIQTTLDASGLTQLQAQIRQAEGELKKLASQDIISEKAASDAQAKIRKLQNALNNAFNSNIGMLDMAKFQKELGSGINSIQDLRSAFALAGATGEKAFIGTLGRLGQLDTGIQSISKTADKMMNTLGNTVRWGIVASGFAQIMNSAHQAVQYVRDLDESLTNIMMVTGQSREQMNAYAQTANEVAKALSSTTVAMTDATLVFAQQGFDTNTSTQLAQRSTQLANISQQDTATTSDQITTMMNAYNFSGDLEAIDRAMDSWAQVANDSAADVGELATASQKAASTAYTVGLTMDQLNAQIATIESVTREAPENIGNALKTIYSRFADISLGETLEDGVDLGTIAQTLGKVGVNVLNDAGELRGVGDIMEDLMGVWDTMDATDQSAISTVIAGRYQLSRFQALMNRSDLYNQYLESSLTAEGTADEMQQIFDESMQGRINQLQATAEGVFNNFFETSDFYGMIDALTQIVDLMSQFIEAVGGGANALSGLGAIATRVFSNSIAGGINNFLNNRERQRVGTNNIQRAKDFVSTMGYNPNSDFGASTDMIDFVSEGLKYSASMSEEEQSQYNARVQQTIELKQKQVALEEKVLQTVTAINLAYGKANSGENPLFTTERNEGTGHALNIVSDEFYRQVRDLDLLKDLPTYFEDLFKGQDGKIYADKLYNAVTPLQRITSDLMTNLTKNAEEVSGAWNMFGESANKAQTYADNISKLNKVLGEQNPVMQEINTRYQAYKTAIDEVRNGTVQNTDALMTATSELNNYLRVVQQVTSMDKDTFTSLVGNLDANIDKMNAAQEGSLSQDRNNKDFTSSLQRKAQIDTVVETTAAIGQLAFSWTAFQGLGSLWANADLDAGEKLTQTILNLAMNLPMLVSSFAELNRYMGEGTFDNLVKSLEDYSNRQKQVAEATTVQTIATQALNAQAAAASGTVQKTSIRTAALGGAATIAARGIGVLNSALTFLTTGPGMVIGALLIGLTTYLGYLEQQRTQKLQEIADQATVASDNLSTLNESMSSFDAAFQEYLGDADNVEVLSTLAEQAEAINGILEDQELKAYAAGDAWESYYARLHNISDSEMSEMLSDISKQTKSAQEEVAQQIGSADNSDLLLGDTILNQNNAGRVRVASEVKGLNLDLTGQWGFNERADVETQLSGLDKAKQIYEEEIAAAEESLANVEEGSYLHKNINDSLSRLQKDYEGLEWLESTITEQRTAYEDALTSQATSEVLVRQNTEEYQYQDEESLEDYKNRLRNTDMYSGWASELGSSAAEKLLTDFVTGMASADVEGSEQLGQKLSRNEAQMGITQRAQEMALAENPFDESAADSYADEIYAKLNQLSDEQILELKAGINTDYLIEDLDSIIARINSGEAVEDIVLSYSVQNKESSNYLDDSARADVLEDLDLTTDDVEAYQEALLGDSSVMQDYKKRIDNNIAALQEQNEEYQRQKDSLVDSGDTSEETADKIADLTKKIQSNEQEIEDNDDALDSMTTMLLESAKGAEELSKVYDDAASVLEDTSSSTYEVTQAVNSMVPGLEHMLNLDMSGWSQDMKNAFVTDNLYDIRDAINGNVEALQRLRGEAAQQILIQAGLDPTSSPQLWSDMTNLIAWANANLPDLEAGASINDQTFINQLNHMIQSAYLAGEDVSAILRAISEMGIDANVKYKSVSVQIPDVEVSAQEGTVAHGAQKMLSGIVSTIKYKAQNMQLPYIEMGDLAYRGGSSGYAPSSPVGGGSGGGSGGGGGGGGGGSAYEPQHKDPIEEEIDRYERVNTMLQAVENDFDRIAEEQDRLVGFDQADNMNKQIELLQRQIALHKEKLEIQKQEAEELRSELSSQYGITFDDEGFIDNYASIHQKLIDNVNNLVGQYNAEMSEAGQEALAEQIEDAKDRLDDFNETYQRYDELWSGDLKDTLKSLEDLEDQIEDIRIEAFQTSVDAADNIKDIQTTLNEFNQVFSGLDSDDPFRQMALSVSNLKNYFDVATDSVSDFYDELISRTQEQLESEDLSEGRRKYLEQQIAMMKEAQEAYGDQTMEEYGTGYLDMTMLNLETMLAQIKQWEETGTSSIFGENSGDMFEVAQDVFDQATSMIEDYEDEIDDLRDAILDAIDEIADEMDRRVEAYEAITDELEHQNDIIELLRGENAYEEINKVLAAQQNNYQAQISEMQQQLDIWKDMQEAMEEGSDEWLAIQENITDTQQDLNDLVQESLENLQEQYDNTVNSITDSWVENAVGTDLDWMSEQWELINRNADYYLDDVNAAYETQKLQGKYLELLDQSNDLHVQQMITEQMKQQLGYLRDKEKLSEYDVAYANAQLEILQKRIALEEAQRNKSQMKLRRDSQGNYSYVYTADEGDVAAAEGDLLDAENNAYNLSKEQMKQTQDDSLSALTDAQQLINDIWTNANLTLEEKKERTQTIIDSLKEYLAGTSEQLSTSETNIINDFIGMVEMLTDENAERLDDVYQQIINGNLDAFDQIDDRWSTSLTDWLYNMDEFNTSTDGMFEGLIDNATEYQDQIDKVGDLVEQDFNDMSGSIQNAIDKTNDLSNSTADFINQLRNDAGVIKDYENTLQEYADKISDVTNEMRAYQDQVNELANKLTAKEQENAVLTAQVAEMQEQLGYQNGSGSGGAGGAASGLSDVKAGSVVGFNGWYYYDSYGQAPAGKMYSGQRGAVRVSSFSASPYGNNSEAPNYGNYKIHIETKSGGHLGWVKPSQLLFDTGGYTGAWSGSGSQDAKDGKLAFLHQKELVLNANDTKNILAAVDIVREITQQMKSGLLGGMLSSMSSASRASQNNATQDIQQEVHITAEFPNANSASEIEQAILSLNERAVQYSFKR